ncbi:Augmin complex subunit wac [Lucilia cuprina]|nr:Augmin complex subunit wac [Lucilia cuprina]
MDSLLISEEIKQLKRLREFYEDQLKLVGIEMCDLGDDIHNLLDEAVELQRVTNLQDMSLTNLQTFYYKKKKEHLDNKAIIVQLKNEIKKQQKQIEKEQNECNLLENLGICFTPKYRNKKLKCIFFLFRFTTSINKRLVSEAQMQSSVQDIESSMKKLQEHLDTLNIPDDFNIDELIQKVELLKNEKSKDKKEF